jgi:adenosylhomocysteinase
MKYDVADLALAPEGKKRIIWADNDMPVLAAIRKRFAKVKPLKGKNVSACLHITAETANLARTLKASGANVVLCASNPLSTQDDVAASLVKDFGIAVFAICGENRTTYYKHINAAIDNEPVITFDGFS